MESDMTSKQEPNTAPVPIKAVERYRAAKAAIKQWEEVAAKARGEIEAALGENETGTYKGKPVVLYKHGKRTALDQKLLAELYPDVKAECMATTATRTMTLVDTDE